MSKPKITLGLSLHRPEMVAFLANLMRSHDVIVLEEPPVDGFHQMLQGALAVDDYLQNLDVEYPVFSREMCYLLRRLWAEGKSLYQVEPFLEILIGIHEFFAENHRPGDLDPKSVQYPVYLAERNATGALLSYYQTVMSGSFKASIEAIIKFARLDAARFRLRDSLRVQALVPLIKNHSSVFIEAGLMHYPLWRLLRRQLPRSHRVRLKFIADTALQKLDEKGRLFGPGDLLTLLYIFNSSITQPQREALLAARSLIYSKIIQKEESSQDVNLYPHLRDELACIQMARRLSIDDCQRLFPLVRKATWLDARQIVHDFLAQ
ncbi:MAG: hypothetical protein PVH42_08630 [Desulfobacterales bacterium]|jgi:hypothetical protein